MFNLAFRLGFNLFQLLLNKETSNCAFFTFNTHQQNEIFFLLKICLLDHPIQSITHVNSLLIKRY